MIGSQAISPFTTILLTQKEFAKTATSHIEDKDKRAEALNKGSFWLTEGEVLVERYKE